MSKQIKTVSVVVYLTGILLTLFLTGCAKSTKEVVNLKDILVLVNKERVLPSDYVPPDLVVPDVRYGSNMEPQKKLMRREAAEALEELFQNSDQQKTMLYSISAYRSFQTQKKLYNQKVKLVGEDEANQYVAYPGQSEHQTGLAVDVTNEKGMKNTLTDDFGDTKEGKWLKDNAYKYGFIIRYLKGKESITGYHYEPWHIRYVGKKAAKEVHEKGMILEEYLDMKKE